MKIIIAIISLAFLASCSSLDNPYVQGKVGFYKPAYPSDPGSQFGLFVSRKPPVEIINEK